MDMQTLLWKLCFHENQLTPKERHDGYMTAWSISFDFLELKDLKETRDDLAKHPAPPGAVCNCGCDFGAAIVSMLDGKIALREMQCLKQRRPKIIRFPKPPTSKKRRTPKRP